MVTCGAWMAGYITWPHDHRMRSCPFKQAREAQKQWTGLPCCFVCMLDGQTARALGSKCSTKQMVGEKIKGRTSTCTEQSCPFVECALVLHMDLNQERKPELKALRWR